MKDFEQSHDSVKKALGLKVSVDNIRQASARFKRLAKYAAANGMNEEAEEMIKNAKMLDSKIASGSRKADAEVLDYVESEGLTDGITVEPDQFDDMNKPSVEGIPSYEDGDVMVVSKTASAKTVVEAKRKARLAVRLAILMLGDKSPDEVIEKQASAFAKMDTTDLEASMERYAATEELYSDRTAGDDDMKISEESSEEVVETPDEGTVSEDVVSESAPESTEDIVFEDNQSADVSESATESTPSEEISVEENAAPAETESVETTADESAPADDGMNFEVNDENEIPLEDAPVEDFSEQAPVAQEQDSAALEQSTEEAPLSEEEVDDLSPREDGDEGFEISFDDNSLDGQDLGVLPLSSEEFAELAAPIQEPPVVASAKRKAGVKSLGFQPIRTASSASTDDSLKNLFANFSADADAVFNRNH